jgi:hypothetical protein
MVRMRSALAVAAALAAVGALALARSASAAPPTQVDGAMVVVYVGDPFDITDDVSQVWGDLIGFWRTTTFDLGVATKSGVVTGSGTERFDGCLDANGNGVCDGSDPTGALFLTFTYSGKFDPVTFALLHGRCHHPITGGTGGFSNASGVIQMRDDPVTGCTYYRGHVSLG